MSTRMTVLLLCALLLLTEVGTAAAKYKNTSSSGFELAGVQHVDRTPAVVKAEKRGFHFVATVPQADPTTTSSIVYGVGICGELSTFKWDWLSPSTPNVTTLHTIQSLEGLRQSRTILLNPRNATTIIVGGRSFQLWDVSDPKSPSIISNVTLPSDTANVGDSGINGIIAVPNGSITTLIGAYMPGDIHVAQLTDDGLRAIGVVKPVVPGTNGEAMPSVFDIDIYTAPDQSIYAVIVSGRQSTVGMLGVVKIGEAKLLFPVENWKIVGTLQSDWSGCNRVRVHKSFAFFSCFGSSADNVGFVDISDPSNPKLRTTFPYNSEQPTGMLVVGDALLVAGGRHLMIFNVSDPATASIVAICGDDVCGNIMLSDGQNAHSVAHTKRGEDHFIFFSAQIDNNVGAVRVLDHNVVSLLSGSQLKRRKTSISAVGCRNDTDCYDLPEWKCTETSLPLPSSSTCFINGQQQQIPPFSWPARRCQCTRPSSCDSPSPPPVGPGGFDCRGGRCIPVTSGSTANSSGSCEWSTGCVGLAANEWLADIAEWSVNGSKISCKVRGTFLKKSEDQSSHLPSNEKLAIPFESTIQLTNTPKPAGDNYWIVSCGAGSICSGNNSGSTWDNRKRYLMIGDSISLGYFPYVSAGLANTTYVEHSVGNAGNANNIVHELDCYLNQAKGTSWDIVSFNAGIHDLAKGQEFLSIDIYSELIYNISVRLIDALGNSAGADNIKHVFFVTTTPVPTNITNRSTPAVPEGILDSDVQLYNAAAEAAVKRASFQGTGVSVSVVDVYGVVIGVCGRGYSSCPLQRQGNPHFLDPGWKLLGQAISRAVHEFR